MPDLTEQSTGIGWGADAYGTSTAFAFAVLSDR
jgi:hypothetical protein